jgi:hypothetical protein
MKFHILPKEVNDLKLSLNKVVKANKEKRLITDDDRRIFA